MKDDILIHHGVKGQKWGVRNYTNPDGTLNREGKKRLKIAGKGAYQYAYAPNAKRGKFKETYYGKGRYAKVISENKDSYKVETGYSDKARRAHKQQMKNTAHVIAMGSGILGAANSLMNMAYDPDNRKFHAAVAAGSSAVAALGIFNTVRGIKKFNKIDAEKTNGYNKSVHDISKKKIDRRATANLILNGSY